MSTSPIAAVSHDAAFYEAAAGVIPVLFLALIYERRFFEKAEEAIDPLLDVIVVAMFVIGEMAALWALAANATSTSAEALVATPLLIAGLGLVAPIVGPRLRRVAHAARRHERRGRRWAELVWVWVNGAAVYGPPTVLVAALWLRVWGL